MTFNRPLASVLALSLVLTSCGAQDYDNDTTQTGTGAPVGTPTTAPDKASKVNSPTNQVRLAPKRRTEGYIWRGLRWMEVSDDTILDWKCSLRDGRRANQFQAWGTTLLSGAILGVVIRASGAWYLGRPLDPEIGHWFWDRLDHSALTVKQGVVRGMLAAGACSILLSGASLWPLDGLIGENFQSFSSAIAIGGLAGLAAAKPLGDWLDRRMARLPMRRARTRGTLYNATATIMRWTATSEIGKGVRYKLAPGLTIFGVGYGVGLLVFEHLQSREGDSDLPPPQSEFEEECLKWDAEHATAQSR